ncbi:ABC transporter permease [Acidobacterium sp. S8]|uniref:ABC transporter permease n=1 Tax=Acidobacterium sp. S8 TaxID=1641854 RepID=UPI0020B13AA8|nr:ABC transporter permease [Acidobacterium sp. S8]
MRWLSKLSMQIKMLFGRTQEDTRLADELEFHIEQQIAENVAAGMSAEEARHAALRIFGNPTLLREQARETWSWNWLDRLAHDLRQGIRTLTRTPGFAALAVLVMALGIGANVALLTVIRSVLMKPLPFKDADRLVRLFEADSKGRFQDNIVAGGTFGRWKQDSHSFEDMAVVKRTVYNLSGTSGQLPELMDAYFTSSSFFAMLGVQPVIGRSFTRAEDRPEGSATVVLAWGLWKRRFGGSPGILGKTILLDSKPYTVIGVLPAWFSYPDPKVQLWTALYHEKSPEMMQMFAAHNFDVVARLKPGISIAQATADLNSVQRQIRVQNPEGAVNDAVNIRPMLDAEVRDVKTGLYVVFAATGCLLLIACLNITNLLVARAAARRRETAIRAALGGSMARLVREQVIESLLLSIAGGGVGLLFAEFILQWLVSARDDIPRADAIHMDWMVLLAALGVVLVCGLFSGIVPAISSGHRKILTSLNESSRSHSGGQKSARLRQVLLALEVGLTVVLLVGAGLLIKSYRQLRSVNLGCATRNVLSVDINLPKINYNTAEKRVLFYEQLVERVRQLPGVRGVGVSTVLPGQGMRRNDTFNIPERPPLPQGQVLVASTSFVDPEYFHAMQIPLLQGRFLQPDERMERAQSVVVNQAFVRQYFPAENPIGKHIVASVIGNDESYEIVGVAGDSLEDLDHAAVAMIYYPLYAGSERSTVLAVRTASNPDAVAIPIQKIVADLDRDLPVANILTMDQILGQSTQNQSFDATLLLAFAVLSLVLAGVGLFGVLSYIVAQRTTEIGIRIALGAPREQVMKLMLVRGLKPALFGLIFGVAASFGLARYIESLLYGVHPFDPLVLLVVCCLLLVVASIACAVPAWRASQLDPIEALRAE